MANKIITKNSSTAGAVPTAVDLVTGELAVNVTDKRLFTENAGGTIVELGTNPSELNFKDNAKAIFGNGSDLQIYHDSSNSYISEDGTGNLNIQGNNLILEDPDGVNFLGGNGSTGAVTVYYNGVAKLATTSTGIDVTGTVVADELTVDNIAVDGNTISSTTGSLLLEAAGAFTLDTDSVERVRVSSIGDVSFYEDTGTTAKFFWDASAESVLVGGASTASAHSIDESGSLFLQSQTNNANIGLSIYVNEGANNRRASFFVDDSLGVYGVESTATSGVPDFVIRRGGNEVARFTGDGLTFNGDTAAANALDDYEEGTWTPVIADAATGGNTSATSASSAIYTKVGRLVTVQCQFTNVSTAGLTAGEDLHIRGLPFVAASVAGTMLIPGSATLVSTTFSGFVNPVIFDNNSYLRFAESISGGTNIDYLIVSEFTNTSADIYLNITYQAANYLPRMMQTDF